MKTLTADMCFMQEVIICTKARRGNGTTDPIRVITEIFTKEGEKIAEYDPLLVHPDQDQLMKEWLNSPH
jgi:hypothetical protein